MSSFMRCALLATKGELLFFLNVPGMKPMVSLKPEMQSHSHAEIESLTKQFPSNNRFLCPKDLIN